MIGHPGARHNVAFDKRQFFVCHDGPNTKSELSVFEVLTELVSFDLNIVYVFLIEVVCDPLNNLL